MEKNRVYAGPSELARLFKIEVDQYNRGKWGKARCYVSLGGACYMGGSLEQKEEFAGRVAAMLVDRGLFAISEELIRKEMPYLKKEETAYLSQVVKNYLLEFSQGDPQQYQEELQARILECLEMGEVLNIDGFVRFRMQDYLENISQCLGDAVDHMVRQYESEIYIGNLKELLGEKRELGFPVFLQFQADGGVLMLDGEGRKIVMEEGEEQKARSYGLSDEDIALCCLMALNPREVHLLNYPNAISSGFYSTICALFEERIKECAPKS
ncbi:putative sporulation protein YtxC [Christensenella sp. MSJ-20]|uniref:sporulation protein YtxC n=1 Tax=Christensenella sp. MSJ-20 TaxID=2841518 RepID=UPI001C761FB5|nr:putative sporulation protein YtxC [Christensenella sp. MSJ-20]